MRPAEQRCETITKLRCHCVVVCPLYCTISFYLICTMFLVCNMFLRRLKSANYCLYLLWRDAVSWVTSMAVTDPSIVFASHPSCQSGSRTKAAKPRMMTSCLGSAPYLRGLNTVQLAFCVWGRFSDGAEYRESPLSISWGPGMHPHRHAHTQQHTSLDPWAGALSQEWALRQGVTTGTAAGAGSQS